MSTDVLDLTDAGVNEILSALMNVPVEVVAASQRTNRAFLSFCADVLDHSRPGWPQRLLGLPEPWTPRVSAPVLELADPKELQNDGDPIRAAAMPPVQP